MRSTSSENAHPTSKNTHTFQPLRPRQTLKNTQDTQEKMMKRYLITAGLLFGLAGLSASAQTTPNTDPNHPQAGVPSTPPTFPTDSQAGTTPQSPASQDPTAPTKDPNAPATAPDTDRTNRGQADADQTTSSPTSSQSGSTGSMSSSQSGDQSTTGATGQSSTSSSGQSSTGSQSQPEQGGMSGSSASGSSAAGGDAQGQIQAALQQKGLSNVQANVSADSIELTGTVNSADEKKEAKKIAKQYAGGKKVKDSLTVAASTK
jgi:BON domain